MTKCFSFQRFVIAAAMVAMISLTGCPSGENKGGTGGGGGDKPKATAKTKLMAEQLPAGAIDESIVGLIVIDFDAFKPARVDEAINAVVPQKVRESKMFKAQTAEFMDKFKTGHKSLTDAGMKGPLVFAMAGNPDAKPIIAVKMDAKAANKVLDALAKEMDKDKDAKDRPKIVDAGKGWSFMLADGAVAPEGKVSNTKLAEAFNITKGDVRTAFVPNEQMKKQGSQMVEMQGGQVAPSAGDTGKHFAETTQWMAMSMSLGKNPALNMIVKSKDKASADKGVEQWNKLLTEGKDQLTKMKEQVPDAQKAAVDQLLKSLDNIKASADNDMVKVTFDGPTLAMIIEAANTMMTPGQ